MYIKKLLYLLTELEKKKPLKLAFYLSGGLCIFFALFASLLFDFVGLQDINLEKNGWPIDALQSDRANLLKTDAWRSFIFITLTFSLLWLFIKNKIQSKYVILSIGVLILLDMWTVNKRYLNNDHFARKSKVEKPYNKTQADQQI